MIFKQLPVCVTDKIPVYQKTKISNLLEENENYHNSWSEP